MVDARGDDGWGDGEIEVGNFRWRMGRRLLDMLMGDEAGAETGAGELLIAEGVYTPLPRYREEAQHQRTA